ncbi:uncharacterized protein LOC124937727 [Impatiens glandulifera]|uniref:uncharacterized protein LOC124937727 n=1 Tax=Impatiens glandulifera TaxID=253017 RepID=UPI001FB0A99A|nr:uncharacterized protein LOC124937727 [Impatiens glandulifera]
MGETINVRSIGSLYPETIGYANHFVGDMNEMRDLLKRFGSRRLTSIMSEFFKTIDNLELVDPPLKGERYTFRRGSGSASHLLSSQDCLGALDGTLIKVTPPNENKSRYRTRKGCISTNVLGVCCPKMQFIYVLPGWEGSAHDGRDAISRPNGLRVPLGCYYLTDSGYCNAKGFLVPYRGQRYHLKEFDGHRPETLENTST